MFRESRRRFKRASKGLQGARRQRHVEGSRTSATWRGRRERPKVQRWPVRSGPCGNREHELRVRENLGFDLVCSEGPSRSPKQSRGI